MSNLEIPKYSKINGLHKVKEILFHDNLVITEKLHGTNIRFGKVDGNLYIGSRKQIIYDGEYYQDFDSYKFYNWFWENIDYENLPDNHLFFGEFIGENIQKGVNYLPKGKEFVGFDIKLLGDNGDFFMDFNDMKLMMESNGIKVVPEVSVRGKYVIEDLDSIVDGYSEFANMNSQESIMEGIVIRPEKETRDRRGDRLLAKYKNDKFSEKQKAPKNKSKKNNYYFDLGKQYSTEGRIENSIDKLRQQTSEELEEKHIPDLIKIFKSDVEEDADFIPEEKDNKKQFFKGAQSNVVPYYKQWLLK